MNPFFILVLAGVAGLSAGLTIRLVACRSRGLDYPKGHSMHSVPTPRLGGVAVMVSTFAGVIVSGWIVAGEFDRSVLATLGSALGLFAFFVIEDVVGVFLWKRLVVQVLAASAFLLASGTWQGVGQLVPSVLSGLPLGLVLLAGMVWAMNLYNFMDGMDGLAGGMSVSGFVTLGLLAFLTGHEWVGVTACAAAAGSLGFLIFNIPPARIFLGDAGSVPLGFLGASLGLKKRGCFLHGKMDHTEYALQSLHGRVDAALRHANDADHNFLVLQWSQSMPSPLPKDPAARRPVAWVGEPSRAFGERRRSWNQTEQPALGVVHGQRHPASFQVR